MTTSGYPPNFADEISAIADTDWARSSGGWEGLIDFSGDNAWSPSRGAKPCSSPSSPVAQPMSRARSDPTGEQDFPPPQVSRPNAFASSSRDDFVVPQFPLTPGKKVSCSSDSTWKTVLSSLVMVEGVGEMSVARVLQELWRHGGGDIVS